MYLAYWGLTDTPFRDGRLPRFFYRGPAQEEVLARLEFLVENRQRLGLLVGPAGCGKSSLLEIYGRELERSGGQVIYVSLIGLSGRDLLWEIAAQFGLAPPVDAPTSQLWRKVADRLQEQRYSQRTTVLLADDAHQATAEAQTMLQRLLGADPSPDARLTMLLAAADAATSRLPLRLLQCAAMCVEVEAWEPEDTAAYLEQALAAAGRTKPIFTDAALRRLHELGGGVPRMINRLADLALFASAAEGATEVDDATIAGVSEELFASP